MAQSIDDWVIVVALPVKPLAQLMIQLSVRPTTRATVYCAAVANVKSGAEQIASNFGITFEGFSVFLCSSTLFFGVVFNLFGLFGLFGLIYSRNLFRSSLSAKEHDIYVSDNSIK